MLAIDTLTDASSWTQTTNIDGTDYVLEFFHSQREGVHYVDVSKDGTLVAARKKVLCNWPIFQTTNGFVFCASSDASDDPPGFGELGISARCQLIYCTFSELKT